MMSKTFREWWKKLRSVPPAKRDDLSVVVVTGYNDELKNLLPHVHKHVPLVKNENIIHLDYHQFEQETHNLPRGIEKVGYSGFTPEFSLSRLQTLVDDKLRVIKTPHVVLISGKGEGVYERTRYVEMFLKVKDTNIGKIDLGLPPYTEN